MVAFLIENARILTRDTNAIGDTPFTLAIRMNSIECIALLSHNNVNSTMALEPLMLGESHRVCKASEYNALIMKFLF
jgi:hypothetical protein